MWSSPKVVRFIGGRLSSEEEVWGRLLRYAGLWSLLGFGYWIVRELENDDFVGEVGFADFRRGIEPPLGRDPEIGWALTPRAWGRGYAQRGHRSCHRLDGQGLLCARNGLHHRTGKTSAPSAWLRGSGTSVDQRRSTTTQRHRSSAGSTMRSDLAGGRHVRRRRGVGAWLRAIVAFMATSSVAAATPTSSVTLSDRFVTAVGRISAAGLQGEWQDVGDLASGRLRNARGVRRVPNGRHL